MTPSSVVPCATTHTHELSRYVIVYARGLLHGGRVHVTVLWEESLTQRHRSRFTTNAEFCTTYNRYLQKSQNLYLHTQTIQYVRMHRTQANKVDWCVKVGVGFELNNHQQSSQATIHRLWSVWTVCPQFRPAPRVHFSLDTFVVVPNFEDTGKRPLSPGASVI